MPVAKYIGKRLLHLIWIMVAISFLTFLLMYLAPGDAAMKKLNAQGMSVSEEVVEKMREDMGLNRPFLVQYGGWAWKALRGDLGTSYKDDFPVAGKLGTALGFTAMLALGSMVISLIISLPLAILTALKRDTWLDYVIRFLTFFGNSMPNFLISLLLMYLFCIKVRLFPVIAKESVSGLFLPTLATSIPMISKFARQTRADVLGQLGEEYVIGMHARGVKERVILYRNVLHNALGAIITIVALQIRNLMAVRSLSRRSSAGRASAL